MGTCHQLVSDLSTQFEEDSVYKTATGKCAPTDGPFDILVIGDPIHKPSEIFIFPEVQTLEPGEEIFLSVTTRRQTRLCLEFHCHYPSSRNLDETPITYLPESTLIPCPSQTPVFPNPSHPTPSITGLKGVGEGRMGKRRLSQKAYFYFNRNIHSHIHLQKRAYMAARKVPLMMVVAAILLIAHATQSSKAFPRLASAPQPIDNPEKDKGLQQVLQFAIKEHDKAGNNRHSSQVVQIISAKKQVTVGVKYTTEVEISQTTEHTICKFIVLSVPWQNQINLLENSK